METKNNLKYNYSLKTEKELQGSLSKQFDIPYKGGSTNTATVNINGNIITVDAKINIEKLEKEYKEVLDLFSTIKIYYSETQDKLNKLNTKIDTYEGRIAALTDKTNEHTKDIINIKTSIIRLNKDISDLKEETQKIINEELVIIEKNISNLKEDLTKKIDNVNTKIDDLEFRLDDIIEKALAKIKISIEKLENNLNILENTVYENVLDINKLHNITADIRSDIDFINQRLDNISETILPLIETKLEELSEEVDKKLNTLDTKINSTKTELDSKIVNTEKTLDKKLNTLDNKINSTKTELDSEIVNIEETLDNKLNLNEYRADKSIIDLTLANKGGAMYYDATGEFDPSGQAKSYWYMISNNDTINPKVIAGPYNFGSGGGGGGGGTVTTKVSIEAVDWPSTIALGASCKLKINWSSLKDTSPTGNGTLAVYVGNKICFTQKNTPQGIVTLDLTDYLEEGTNSVEVRATDAYSNSDKIIQEITTVQIRLDSLFNSDRVLSGNINYIYTPYGAGLLKIVHFIIDGREVGTQETRLSSEQMTYVISGLTHGSHTLKVYFTCDIGGNLVTSNELFYDLIYEVPGDTTPIIASTFNKLEQEQYNSFTIPYRVYTPNHNTSEIKLSVNYQVVQELTVDQSTHYWEYRPVDYGNFTMHIICGETTKEFKVTVKESEINVHAVTQDLSLYLTSTGRSNAEAHPEIWRDEDNNISCTLSNFNFVSDGWLQDTDGNTVLKITGDARVSIPLKIFEKDFRTTGKTIEVELATSLISNYETTIMSCWSGNRGFYITPQIARIKSQQTELFTQYKEDEHVRITFVIEKKEETHLILMYLNGILSGAVQYPLSDDFSQLEPVEILIGSNDATIDIYNIRVYDNNLNRKQVVNNWIADTQSGELKRDRFISNDNYNDSGEIVISKLPSDLPYIIWDIDPLPQYKGDKRKGQAYYKDPLNSKKNFSLPTSGGGPTGDYNVQGTSSSVYPVKNIRLKSKSGFIDDDLNVNKEFFITDGGIGANYFTFKVDYASSEGANNVELVKLYNDASKAAGILTPPQKLDSRVRVGIDGFPIIAFHRANGIDSFCSKANFNNDKANEAVYGFMPGDESWEITNNSADEGNFKKPATAETFANAFEIRFPDEDGYSDLSKLGPMTAWVVSTDPEQATNNLLPEPKQYTYDTVVRSEDGTYGKRTVVSPTFTTDSEEYRLTKFKAELADWFNVDSTVFYYIFTHLYLMIDSRAKNAFPTYFTSRAEGDGGNHWFWLPYDMDTAIGINNEGKLVFDYNLEDTDKIDGTNVFNGQDSVMWNNLRKMFDGEIGQMYSNLRTTGGLISFNETESRFENHQNKWSECIFNEDSYQKYIKVLMDTGDNYLEMLQGSKAEQRKWWLYNRFKYFDSKYLAGDAKSDVFQFRAYAKADVTVTPYADIYATVSYANAAGAVVSVRAERDKSYTLHNPLPESASDQETYIYSASQLKSVGDLSPFMPDTVKAANAIKLQDLKVGDRTPGYENPKLTNLELGKNVLLKRLDVSNCTNLKQAVNISGCTNLEEVYFDGTAITGLALPSGGILKVLHLPNTLTDLEIRNQPLLQDLKIAGTEFVDSLWLENIPMELIDAKSIIMGMPKGGKVRLIGFNQQVETADEIYDLYELLDTMSGKNAQGEKVADAQISGNIYIDTITYEDYQALTHHIKEGRLVYQDIKIIYTNLICKVNFYNEDILYNTQNVKAGNSAETPSPDPVKPDTEKYYYVFLNWDKDYSNIQADIDIHAVYEENIKVFEVKFDTQSSLVHVDSQYIEYGKLATRPKDPEISGATFLGWYKEPNTINIFDFDEPIINETVAYAKWRDDDTPTVELTRLNYNKFEFKLTDNIAIIDYAITKSKEEPTEWIRIVPTAEFIDFYTINDGGTYYVWAKDAAGLIGSNYIKTYNINKIPETGTTIIIKENDSIIDNFALQGTVIEYNVLLDEHYENLTNYCNQEEINDGDIKEVVTDLNYLTVCNPKTYTVSFNIGEYGEPVEDQQIVYLHLVEEPENQYVTGKIIEGWYTDASFSIIWNFLVDKVENNMVLYAKWIDYTEPSIITINVTDDLNVTLNYYQSVSDGVSIDWGDNTELQTVSTRGNTYATHNYSSSGKYIIKTYCNDGQHYLGTGEGRQVITPIEYLTDIEFAWNMATTGAYALSKAINLTKLTIPRFMSELAIGICQNCANLVEINLPNNLKVISNQAMQNCTGLLGEFEIPESVKTIGNYAFAGCANITKFILYDTLQKIDEAAFKGCNSLTNIDLPDSITTIANNLFQDCIGLTIVDIPERITEIGDNAFNGCKNISSLIYRNKNLLVGTLAIHDCPKLISAGPIGGDYNIQFAWEDFIPSNAFSVGVNGSELQTVIIPETVKVIGDYAFGSCSKLKNINLPLGLLTIGAGAFYGCSAIKIEELPPNLESIGMTAFARCYGITNLTIPASVLTIGERVFEYNYAFRDIYLYAPSSEYKIETFGTSWFNRCVSTAKIHIPRAVIDPALSYGPYWNYYDEGKTLTFFADL